MTNWLEHSVQIEVDAPIDLVWGLWSDLQQMPLWMKWIDSVKLIDNNPELSHWKLATDPFVFTWISRTAKLVPKQIIQTESVEGLPNKATIRFYDRGKSSIVKLTVAYSIPGILGQLMDKFFLGRVVESTLMADMKRFKEYLNNVKANA